jgi:hypothetical protein
MGDAEKLDRITIKECSDGNFTAFIDFKTKEPGTWINYSAKMTAKVTKDMWGYDVALLSAINPRCDYEQRDPKKNNNRPYCALGFCPQKLVKCQCGVKRG